MPNHPPKLIVLIEAIDRADRRANEPTPPSWSSLQQLAPEGYLAKRYQIQRPTSGPEPSPTAIAPGQMAQTVIATDTQPQTPTNLAVSVSCDRDTNDGTLDALLTRFPEIIRTHLMLQEELYPSCPQVYDAYSEADYAILLLEDRADMMALADAACKTTAKEQWLHWCYDMVQLWELLTPYQCQCSLLNPENLRVDDEEILCLKRLYENPPQALVALPQLGKLWRQLFESAFDQIPRLAELCTGLEQGTIADIAPLKQQLEAIRVDDERDDVDAAVNAPDAVAMGAPAGPPAAEFDEGDDLPTVVLPMQLYSLSHAGQTDVGRLREHNEDYFFIQTDIHQRDTPGGRTCQAKGLYILCDGMGGHASGEVASKLAVESLRQSAQAWGDQLPTQQELNDWIRQANQTIYDRNQQEASQGNNRMGTTLVMMMVQGLHAVIAHVGDSRLYRISRKLGLEQLTVDHEVGQREIHRGIDPEVAYSRQDAYQLTQALGPRSPEFLRPDILHLPITEDAVFILASDGLTDNDLLEAYYDTHLEALLSSQTNLERGAANLIGLANQNNGHDNITVIVVRVKLRPILPPPGMG